MVKIPKGSEIVNKVLNKSHVLGAGINFISSLGGIQNAGQTIAAVILTPAPPNMSYIMQRVGDHLWVNAPLILLGMLGEAVDVEATNKYFRAIAKYGLGAIAGGALAAALEGSHNPGPGQNPSGTQSKVWLMERSARPVTTSARKLRVTSSQPSGRPSN